MSNHDPTEMGEDYRTLYEDAGEWSRHYSNVRMTVATFVVTSCVAIVALAAEKKPENGIHSPHVGNSVCVLWGLGLFIFYAFTFLTFKERNRQLVHRVHLSVPMPDKDRGKKGARVVRDAAAWAMLSINLLFAFAVYRMPDPITSLSNDLLLQVLVVVSAVSAVFILVADDLIDGTIGFRFRKGEA